MSNPLHLLNTLHWKQLPVTKNGGDLALLPNSKLKALQALLAKGGAR